MCATCAVDNLCVQSCIEINHILEVLELSACEIRCRITHETLSMVYNRTFTRRWSVQCITTIKLLLF